MSRTPLREAIKLLAAEGLVDLLPNRGAVAVQLTEADVADTFEVLAGLEGLSGELAAQRISDAELAEIRALHYEMLAAFTRRDLSAYYRLNAQIHTAINAAARNPVLDADLAQRSTRACSRCAFAPTRTRPNGSARWRSTSGWSKRSAARDGRGAARVLVAAPGQQARRRARTDARRRDLPLARRS